MRSLPWLLAALTTAPVTAQVAFDHVLVAVRTNTPAATLLVEVDVRGGGQTIYPRFAVDGAPPRALRLDPHGNDVFLALDGGANTPVYRLSVGARQVTASRLVGVVPAVVTDFAFAGDDALVLTATGASAGLYQLPRTGGTATRLSPLPRADAVGELGFAGGVLVAQSGVAPATEPQLLVFDPLTGAQQPSGVPMAGYRPFGIRGVFQMQNAVGHVLFANDDGTVSVGVRSQQPEVIPFTPLLPAGATVRVRAQRFSSPLVLGNAAHPFLKEVVNLATAPARPWRIVAGPLPGDPVDFDVARSDVGRAVRFGLACGQGAGIDLFEWSRPHVGNTQFALQAGGLTPNATAILALGTSDQVLRGASLPLALPGGCPLRVSADLLLAAPADAAGFARTPVPIPNSASLMGAVFRGQAIDPNNALAVSPGLAVLVGR